ncbi:hypothetical protein P886_1158 [Alteromonadaceae bacterium 2753L.S.0a.02]|nr:hypothetical protein P886_1158 [Alteromonadaceae bacterium 2753L.S.0a.02]
MFPFLKPPQIVDPDTASALQSTFDWALESFDSDYFANTAGLIHPSREYFPDRADNELDMARALCKRICEYAGLSQWPFTVQAPQYFEAQMPPLLGLTSQTPPQNTQEVASVQHTLEISYASAMMKKPMDLVGSMSKNIAQHYLYQSQRIPPAGPESFDAAAEIIAIAMGFGIFIANSAYTFRGSCARCYDPRANRTAALSEDEAIYTLALFCHYKKIPNKEVTPSLKNYLRGRFKKARKQLEYTNLK